MDSGEQLGISFKGTFKDILGMRDILDISPGTMGMQTP